MTDRPPFVWERVADEQEAERLLSFVRSLTLPPRTCLWHAGDSPALLVRVEEGLLRAKVVLADGREYIKEFYWEGDEFIDFHHLLSGEPARYSVEALEPCRLQLFRWRICADSLAGPPGITISLKCNCASRRRKSCYC